MKQLGLQRGSFVQRESFIWFSGKVLFFIFTCETVGTLDWMCFPWQIQSAQG